MELVCRTYLRMMRFVDEPCGENNRVIIVVDLQKHFRCLYRVVLSALSISPFSFTLGTTTWVKQLLLHAPGVLPSVTYTSRNTRGGVLSWMPLFIIFQSSFLTLGGLCRVSSRSHMKLSFGLRLPWALSTAVKSPDHASIPFLLLHLRYPWWGHQAKGCALGYGAEFWSDESVQ